MCLSCRFRINKHRAIVRYGSKCVYCGYDTFPAVLTFHHLYSELKSRNPTKMFRYLSWGNIIKELEQCVLLCPTCHAILHDLDNKNQSW